MHITLPSERFLIKLPAPLREYSADVRVTGAKGPPLSPVSALGHLAPPAGAVLGVIVESPLAVLRGADLEPLPGTVHPRRPDRGQQAAEGGPDAVGSTRGDAHAALAGETEPDPGLAR